MKDSLEAEATDFDMWTVLKAKFEKFTLRTTDPENTSQSILSEVVYTTSPWKLKDKKIMEFFEEEIKECLKFRFQMRR
ncbi:hypothetical protein Tco_0212881 [Tanacetum coccineum]